MTAGSGSAAHRDQYSVDFSSRQPGSREFDSSLWHRNDRERPGLAAHDRQHEGKAHGSSAAAQEGAQERASPTYEPYTKPVDEPYEPAPHDDAPHAARHGDARSMHDWAGGWDTGGHGDNAAGQGEWAWGRGVRDPEEDKAKRFEALRARQQRDRELDERVRELEAEEALQKQRNAERRKVRRTTRDYQRNVGACMAYTESSCPCLSLADLSVYIKID